MARKRIRSQEETTALAKRLRARWSRGEPLRPWLRRHAEMLLRLVHGGWSWAALADVLEEAGIKYDTKKKWTADWLQSDFHRARAPLKGYARGHKAQVSATAQPVVLSKSFEPATEIASFAPQTTDQRPVERPHPRFKPVSFRPVEPRHPPTPKELAEIEQNRRLTFGHS